MKNKTTIRFFSLAMCFLVLLGMCGCEISLGSSNSQLKNISVPEKIVAKIKKDCDLPDMRDISEDELDVLYGINKADIAYFAGCVTTDSLSKDEVIVIEAMDEGEANTIRDRLQDHYDKILAECKEYLPEEYEVVQNCNVVKDGIYVTLFISTDAEEMNKIYNSYVK